MTKVPAVAFASILFLAASAQAQPASTMTAAANLKWIATGTAGVSTAVVHGDMAKGASHFFLRYDAGFKAPLHLHSADHFATLVSGDLILVVDGREQRLAPGSFFSFTGKAPHAGRCEGSQACVMFIDARAAWDVVPVATK